MMSSRLGLLGTVGWSRRARVNPCASEEEGELDPDLPGLLPPATLKLLAFFGSRGYTVVSIVLTVVHLVFAANAIHADYTSPVSNFERRGWCVHE